MVDVANEGRSLIERFFFSNESMLKRIGVLTFIIVALLAVTLALESAAGIVTVGRLERKVNILKELTLLSEAGFGNREELRSMLNQTAMDLKNYDPDLGRTISKVFPDRNDNMIVEIFSALSSWILISIYLLFNADGGRKMRLLLVILTLVTGVPIASLISELIETPNPFWSVVLTACLGLIPLSLFGLYFYRRNQRQTQAQNSPTQKRRKK